MELDSKLVTLKKMNRGQSVEYDKYSKNFGN